MLKVGLLNLYVANKEVTKLMKKTSTCVYMNIIRKNFLWEKYFSYCSNFIRKLLENNMQVLNIFILFLLLIV